MSAASPRGKGARLKLLSAGRAITSSSGRPKSPFPRRSGVQFARRPHKHVELQMPRFMGIAITVAGRRVLGQIGVGQQGLDIDHQPKHLSRNSGVSARLRGERRELRTYCLKCCAGSHGLWARCLGDSKSKMARMVPTSVCNAVCSEVRGGPLNRPPTLGRSERAPKRRLIGTGTHIRRPSGPAVGLPPGTHRP